MKEKTRAEIIEHNAKVLFDIVLRILTDEQLEKFNQILKELMEEKKIKELEETEENPNNYKTYVG